MSYLVLRSLCGVEVVGAPLGADGQALKKSLIGCGFNAYSIKT